MSTSHNISRSKSFGPEYWNKLTMSKKNRSHIDTVLGRYKSEEFTHLVKKWSNGLEQKKVLKTDLREEAYGEDEILFSLSKKNSIIFAMDISKETTQKANTRQYEKGFLHNYVTADVRDLPFKDNTFGLILSSSTLDHFTAQDDFKKSLLELKRVAHSKGVIIIALNNKYNFHFYLLLKMGRLFGIIPYPVQFYSLVRLKKIFKEVGLFIQDKSYIVHIISPLSTVLLLLRKFIDGDIINTFSERCVRIFKWLGNRKRSRSLSGWFVALKCVKSKG